MSKKREELVVTSNLDALSAPDLEIAISAGQKALLRPLANLLLEVIERMIEQGEAVIKGGVVMLAGEQEEKIS